MPPWRIPSTHLHHNCWFLAFLNFFFFFKKCQSCVQHTWVSKHNRGGWSVLFWRGEEREARTTTRHSLGPRAEASVGTPMGVGWLAARSLGRGSQAPPHAPHAARHARPAPTAVSRLTATARRAQSCPQTQAGLYSSVPQRGGGPPRHLHGTEDTAQQQGTILRVLQTQSSASRGRPWGSTNPSLLFVLLAQGSATPGQRERTDGGQGL